MKKSVLLAIALLLLTSCTTYQLNYAAPEGPDQRVNPYEVKPISTDGPVSSLIRDNIRR